MGGRPGTVAGEMCTNADFSESLFGEVKKCKVNGKSVKSHNICLKIKLNDIAELPASKRTKTHVLGLAHERHVQPNLSMCYVSTTWMPSILP